MSVKAALNARFAYSLATLAILIGFASWLVLSIRLDIVEPETVAQGCLAGGSGWQCTVRAAAVYGFLNNVYGITAVIAGVLATVARSRWLAALALVAGISGAVLYTFELSGIGIVLGALAWVQGAPLTEDDRDRVNHY